MTNHTVTLRNLTTGYTAKGDDSIVITSGIDATMPAGCLTALLGPNGAGKSTLIRTISGNLPPLGGSLQILGRDIAEYTPAELARRLSVVLTERIDSTHLTVKDLVGLGRSPYTGFFGRLSADDLNVVDHAITMVGINHLANRTVATLSDGERQKAMIARALAQQTPVIFLDEPTAFLDYPGKVDIMMLLRRLCREEGKSVLLSTHDLELTLLLSDRLWLLNRTDGLMAGSPEDLIIQGCIGRYFTGKNLRFDTSTGSFRVDFPSIGSVSVSGSGPRAAMIARALNRAGFTTHTAEPEADVVITDEAYVFDGKTYASIESLVSAVSESRSR
ncbi:MAG: ABC transporter ATP-binding protein [Duncaniella sp.]|nr:ABC transporter ATP-binding protein [Duncaniella sp.]